jgi:hypothetical protein
VNADTVIQVLQGLFFPVVVGLVIWVFTQRASDKAAIKKTLVEASVMLSQGDKTEAEAMVAQETVAAAVALADMKTIQEGVALMATAYREERESLTRELDRAVKSSETCLARQQALAGEVDDMRADVERYHREALDLYRRDLYHASALKTLTNWINEHLPKLLQIRPDLVPPPTIEPLPPLHISSDDDVPSRRWYDREPAVDPDDQEV